LRVLFVTPVAFELASGGGRTAAESFLGVLRSPPLDAQVDVLALQTRRAVLPHRLRQLAALLRSAFSRLPSKSLFHADAGTAERVRRAVAAHAYDLVVVNGGDLFFLTESLPPGPARIGLALNVEQDLYAQQTQRQRALPVVGAFFERDLAKLRRDETQGLARLDGVVCLSSEDAACLRTLGLELATLALPTSFSYAPHRDVATRVVRRPLRLGFLAKFGWWPNTEAAQWLIGQVMPELPAGCVELHLYGPGSERFHGAHPAVTAHGFVADLAPVWSQSDVMVSPIHSGSGINVKVVEALYNGKPLLATSYALRGLPPLDDPAIVRLDTAREWVEFLTGERALALANLRPSGGLSEAFSTRSAAPVLAGFLAEVIATARQPARPKISIITVTHNAVHTLQATLDSVRAQDYPDIEHIVIDGGSTDGTIDIIRRNPDRFAYWTSEPDGGIYEAMNKGLAKATGDWVLFLNADDTLHDAHAVSRVFAAAGRPWAGKLVIYGDSVMHVDAANTRLRRSKPLRTIRFKMPFTHQGVFVSAGLLRERPFDTRYRLACDYDFFRDVYARHGAGAFFDSGVCINYFHVGGASYRRLALKHREFLDIIRRHERGVARAFYVASYVVRCLVPERLRDWLGMTT
jgi:hypothetical protein